MKKPLLLLAALTTGTFSFCYGNVEERQEQSTAQVFSQPLQTALFDSEEKGKNLPIRQAPVWFGKSEIEDRLIISLPLYLGMGFELLSSAYSLDLVYLALIAPAAWVVSDLIIAVVHMMTDSLQSTKGPQFIRDFAGGIDDHHKNPYRLAQDSFWSVSKRNHVAAYLPFIISEIFRQNDCPALAYMTGIITFSTAFAQFIHACAHGRHKDSRFIQFLQTMGIILSPEGHRGHHRGNHDTNFCLISGHTEPLASFIYSGSCWMTAKVKPFYDRFRS